MTSAARKSAISDYKERKASAGIYAISCLATGQVWVGRAPDTGAIANRVWFMLRQNASTHRSLQEAWNQQGAEAFTLEIVEVLDPDLTPYARQDALKTRLGHWAGMLGATAI
ncbi:GIY-YIG nuclease family protein [Tabrizicola sp. J26]|uniref:GIY-YIG nuclease family protein n=1 Tax=Alitabrizicola rongguiensis TaxID=2909234 RepID=UPI001F20D7DA|nr:GIY-YIG nuclease family protein [Tabrizicola rongguiensis]MCF1709589.1 GIY-YIG nuclease family protein [Tabrizicola rongguiensis]